MKVLLPLLLVLTALAQQPQPANRWRLTLDLASYHGDYQPIKPYSLKSGESVDTGGDLDGTLGGFTLSLDRPAGDLVSGIDLSLLTGSLDGSATYSGTFAGDTDITADVVQVELRARHALGGDRFRPYLILGIAYWDQETRESGIIHYTPVDLDLPVDRRIDSTTVLLLPGAGVRTETRWGQATLGARAEASVLVGYHQIDATEGGPADDGGAAGARFLLAVDASLPIADSWSLYARTGAQYQAWFTDLDELRPATTWFLSLGVQHRF